MAGGRQSEKQEKLILAFPHHFDRRHIETDVFGHATHRTRTNELRRMATDSDDDEYVSNDDDARESPLHLYEDVVAPGSPTPCGFQPPPSIERKGHVVVAIDIGTAFSGYAMSFSRDRFTIYAMRAVDPFRPAEGCEIQTKIPTVLLLRPDGTFHSFGQDALTHYNRDLEEDEQKKWYCFERFKMSLHSKQVRHV